MEHRPCLYGGCPRRGFAELVKRMRDAQRAYFASRTEADLAAAKQLEREVDAETGAILGRQERLPF